MTKRHPYGKYCHGLRQASCALLVAVSVAVPARAQDQEGPQPACWFYKYQWAYFRMVPNVWPPTTFTTSGVGTGLMVTDGKPPSPQESAAITDSIQKSLPRGDVQAPPPQASITSISRVACPQALNGMNLSVARIWLRQPEPAQDTGAPMAGSTRMRR